jgi:hypothetical protein
MQFFCKCGYFRLLHHVQTLPDFDQEKIKVHRWQPSAKRPEVGAQQHIRSYEEKYPRRQEFFLKKPQEKKSVKNE